MGLLGSIVYSQLLLPRIQERIIWEYYTVCYNCTIIKGRSYSASSDNDDDNDNHTVDGVVVVDDENDNVDDDDLIQKMFHS